MNTEDLFILSAGQIVPDCYLVKPGNGQDDHNMSSRCHVLIVMLDLLR